MTLPARMSATLWLVCLVFAFPRVAMASGEHAVSVTRWTENGELFMEYLPPVAGKPARFTAHLTELKTFRAVVRATATLRLKKADRPAVEGRADAAARPGIFQPVVTFPEAGEYSGELVVAGDDLSETFELESIPVLAAGEQAPHPDEEEPMGDQVSFLKEQQWKIPFRTVIAGRRRLVHSVHALGEVKPKPGHDVTVTSPVEGRVVNAPPEIGTHVKAGDFLFEIAPFLASDVDRPHLDQELVQAEAELAKAENDVNRIEGLVGKGVMPVKELEAARTLLTIARSKVASARQHRQAYLAAQTTETSLAAKAQHFQVKAPISGEVTHVLVTRDQLVTRDKPLVELDDLSRVWIETRVFEADLPSVRDASSAMFTLPGFEHPFPLEELSGKIIHVSHHVEAVNRTAPVIFEIANPREFPIGGFVEADIFTSRSGQYLAVPVEALMDEGARSVIFVHTEGEAFEKREVTPGLIDRGYVEIRTGVKPGERVVTTGAYEIKLSTLSGTIPEHGHTH